MTELVLRRSAFVGNFRYVAERAGGSKHVIPVVKANAYGHGAAAVIRILRQERPWGFTVASSAEALELRGEGITDRLLVLSYWDTREVQQLQNTKTEYVVWDRDSITNLETVARRTRQKIRVHLKIDTGASRIGVFPNDVDRMVHTIQRSSHLVLTGAFSHFADAEGSSLNFTKQQTQRFLEATKALPQSVQRHISCTAAVLRIGTASADLVRVGIGLYVPPSGYTLPVAARKKLTPALSWHTTILQVKHLQKGTSVGYSQTFTTKRPTLLAVLPIGYADGFPRSLSNKGEVIIRGRRCPVIGRVCMNLTMIDVTDVPQTKAGDCATLLGRQGKAMITTADFAERAGSIDYEILARLPAHLPRRYTT